MKNNVFVGLFMLAFLVVVGLATYPWTSPLRVYPFLSGADTLGSITSVDTVKYQLGDPDLGNPGSWITFTQYITAANKSGEQTVVYALADDSSWTYAPQIRFQLSSSAGDLTSGWIYIGDRAGALTLFVQPDTITSPDSTIYKVRLRGQ